MGLKSGEMSWTAHVGRRRSRGSRGWGQQRGHSWRLDRRTSCGRITTALAWQVREDVPLGMTRVHVYDIWNDDCISFGEGV